MFFVMLISLISISQARERNEYTTQQPLYMYNSTTCKEFLYNTTFDKMSIAETDWKIFYFWNPQMESSYNIVFHIPSGTLIDRFKVELDDDLKPPVNWTHADFFMESTIDFSALFIRTNVSGLYRIIPSLAFQNPEIPVLMFALKLVPPGYLGIMNCEYRIAYALAPVQSMPTTDQLNQAADKLNFTNGYGRPYTVEDPLRKTIEQPSRIKDDALDDEELQIEVDAENLEIF